MPDGSAQIYDVFVSYAHADNERSLGTVAEYGWVTTLAHNLNTGPGHLRKNLFIDHQLKPGDVFSDDLVTKVENSTILLLLLSQNDIDSTWSGKELARSCTCCAGMRAWSGARSLRQTARRW